MPEYRLYCFDKHGHIHRSDILSADDDGDAEAKAALKHSAENRELWRGPRLICSLKPAN
jgi:hypothetical protein